MDDSDTCLFGLRLFSGITYRIINPLAQSEEMVASICCGDKDVTTTFAREHHLQKHIPQLSVTWHPCKV